MTSLGDMCINCSYFSYEEIYPSDKGICNYNNCNSKVDTECYCRNFKPNDFINLYEAYD